MSGLDDHFGRINETITMFQNVAQSMERLADEKLMAFRIDGKPRLVRLDGDNGWRFLVNPAFVSEIAPAAVGGDAKPSEVLCYVTMQGDPENIRRLIKGSAEEIAAKLGFEIS